MSILLLLKHAEKVLKAYGNFPHAAAPTKHNMTNSQP